MKAARYEKHGGPEVIEIIEIDNPQLNPDGVLVENYAASLNPFDYKVRSGNIPGMPKEFPITIGGDFAGKIIELGNNVKDYKAGDEVYGQASVFGGATGSMAELLATKPDSISLKPSNLNFYEAASFPLVGCSAIQALHDHIDLKKDQKILIQGGSGGIGSVAIQIAKKIGAYVATTVSGEGIDYVDELGADKIIDYKNEDFSGILNDYDAIFDTTGKQLDKKSFLILKKGAVIVSMASVPEDILNNSSEIKVIAQNTKINHERLERLKKYIEDGYVKPRIEKEFKLDETRNAYEYQENQKVIGKVVIKIR